MTIAADRARIVQLLGNLLGNALKFTPEGGRVALRVSQQDHQVRFEVADTGPGIPPADLPHIFDQYWKGAGQGTGLGLFIARSIARAHRGDLELLRRAPDHHVLVFAIHHAIADGWTLGIERFQNPIPAGIVDELAQTLGEKDGMSFQRRQLLQILSYAFGSSLVLPQSELPMAAQDPAPPAKAAGKHASGGTEMEKVAGIGGLFFRAQDPDALGRWYLEHLGIALTPTRTSDS